MDTPTCDVTKSGHIIKQLFKANFTPSAKFGLTPTSPCVGPTAPPGVDRVEPVEPVTVVQGSLVTLTCEARGVPPPTLTWLKDGQPLSLHRNLLLDGRETRLQLPDVAPSDGGLYSCVASNQAGSSTKSFNLTVLGTTHTIKQCWTRLGHFLLNEEAA